MVSFLKNIFGLPPLSTYEIPQAFAAKVIEVKPEQRATDTGQSVHGGKVWQTKWEAPLTVVMEAVSNVSATGRSKVLDEYDKAYLNDAGLAETGIALAMKAHWADGLSAESIEKLHTVGKKLERGFSERNAAKYIKAFYMADDRRKG